jgi:membrane-associated phospholipid phosphatase
MKTNGFWKYLERESKPRKGLMPVEWVMMAYTAVTLLLLLFLSTKIINHHAMLWGRVQAVTMVIALWIVYRIYPCRVTILFRVLLQLALLSWWYPDTYEFNRLFPNLDHIFASWEQQMFGLQPALLFSQTISNNVFSELMHLGYASYYIMIVGVPMYYFVYQYKDFERMVFVFLTAFFAYYVIYILVPVTGPQYYYLAAGIDNIEKGIFPNVHDYFLTHQEALPSPGYTDGMFYQFVLSAHNAGERPTAAFPSSHVGIATIFIIYAWLTRSRRLFLSLLPLYVLLCFSTVYIRAHYVIDVLGGWLTAVLFFVVLHNLYGVKK